MGGVVDVEFGAKFGVVSGAVVALWLVVFVWALLLRVGGVGAEGARCYSGCALVV